MEQVIPADYVGLGIGEEEEAIALLLAEFGGFLRGVNADSHGAHAGIMEFLKVLLNASQLEVAIWSPVSSIEN